MKASKFPVTYNGEQFRVSVADAGANHDAKVYVKRRGFLGKIVPFRKVAHYDIKDCNKSRADDVITTAEHVVRCYVKKRDDQRKERETEAAAWRKFAEWDGEVGS